MTTTPEPAPGTRRVRTVDGWVHTQIRQADGTWWNITVERAKGAR